MTRFSLASLSHYISFTSHVFVGVVLILLLISFPLSALGRANFRSSNHATPSMQQTVLAKLKNDGAWDLSQGGSLNNEELHGDHSADVAFDTSFGGLLNSEELPGDLSADQEHTGKHLFRTHPPQVPEVRYPSSGHPQRSHQSNRYREHQPETSHATLTDDISMDQPDGRTDNFERFRNPTLDDLTSQDLQDVSRASRVHGRLAGRPHSQAERQIIHSASNGHRDGSSDFEFLAPEDVTWSDPDSRMPASEDLGRQGSARDGTAGAAAVASGKTGEQGEPKRRRSRQTDEVNGSTWAAMDRRWINHMCAAQCDACTQNAGACQTICRDNSAQRNWITMCPNFAQEFQDFNNLEHAYQTNATGCPGTCSILRNQNDASYFIPMTPELVLVRDMGNRSVTLTWSRPGTREPVVFVVQEREQIGSQNLRQWTAAHLVMGGGHFTRYNLDVCSTPTYRVAAVSRFGSYWFSPEVSTPAIAPEKPLMFRATRSSYDDNFREFTISVSWQTPRGFNLKDLRPNNPYMFQAQFLCDGRLAPDIFVDDTNYDDLENTLTFHVIEEVVNCEIVLMLSATSACDDRLESQISYLSLNFSCLAINDIYGGSNCDHSNQYIPPMNVQNVQVTVLPTGQHGVRAHVTWWPPRDLGSEGRVDYYVLFYGFIHPIFQWGFDKNVYGNITVPGDILQAEIAVPTSTNDVNNSSRFGILVMPGVNGHEIGNPIGIMHVVPSPTFAIASGTALLENDDLVIYYKQESPSSVEVYWIRPEPNALDKRDATGGALLWGPVSEADVNGDVTNSGVTGNGNVTYTAVEGQTEFVGEMLETNIVVVDADHGGRETK